MRLLPPRPPSSDQSDKLWNVLLNWSFRNNKPLSPRTRTKAIRQRLINNTARKMCSLYESTRSLPISTIDIICQLQFLLINVWSFFICECVKMYKRRKRFDKDVSLFRWCFLLLFPVRTFDNQTKGRKNGKCWCNHQNVRTRNRARVEKWDAEIESN